MVEIIDQQDFLIRGMSGSTNVLEISEQKFSPNTIKIFNDRDIDTTRIKLLNWLSTTFGLNLISTEFAWETISTSMDPGYYKVPCHKFILASKKPFTVEDIANCQ